MRSQNVKLLILVHMSESENDLEPSATVNHWLQSTLGFRRIKTGSINITGGFGAVSNNTGTGCHVW